MLDSSQKSKLHEKYFKYDALKTRIKSTKSLFRFFIHIFKALPCSKFITFTAAPHELLMKAFELGKIYQNQVMQQQYANIFSFYPPASMKPAPILNSNCKLFYLKSYSTR